MSSSNTWGTQHARNMVGRKTAQYTGGSNIPRKKKAKGSPEKAGLHDYENMDARIELHTWLRRWGWREVKGMDGFQLFIFLLRGNGKRQILLLEIMPESCTCELQYRRLFLKIYTLILFACFYFVLSSDMMKQKRVLGLQSQTLKNCR